jgi:hypothetical protein
MLLIAGVSPRLVTLDAGPRRCPRCGLFQAREQRIDHYLSLFFVPLLRVRTGESFIACDRCREAPGGPPAEPPREPAQPLPACPGCGRPLASDHRFCPGCGRPR